MNGYVSSHLQGGLGNYLFQISAAYGVSIRDNKELKIDISDIAIVHSPLELYSNNIFRNITFGEIVNFESIHSSEHSPISYLNIPVVNGNLKLDGYYQNEKYFKQYRNEILNLFKIDEATNQYLNEKYSDITFENTCSIHVRRGNYVERQNFHPLQTIEYYKQAISIIGEESLFLIFSDDIEWCKINLDFIKNKIFISGNLDYQDLYLMSMCNHNIIANSSFSWWGAWLNKHNNKAVIYPSYWFNNGPASHEIGGESWIKI
jgi:hypothetical protein